jgi:cell division protein FtsZ
VTVAAVEIRAAAHPEAKIIFGTSYNDRLGEEVAITVIATGFDGRRHTMRTSAPAAATSDAPARAPRDFLEELERQRGQLTDAGVPDAPPVRVDEGANGAGRAAARSVGEPVPVKKPAYDADDLEIPSFLRRSR